MSYIPYTDLTVSTLFLLVETVLDVVHITVSRWQYAIGMECSAHSDQFRNFVLNSFCESHF